MAGPAPRPGDPHAGRHQRLPAAPRRHPGVRPLPRRPAAGGGAAGLRPRLEGRRGVRRRPAVRGGPPPHLADAPHPRRRPPRRARWPGGTRPDERLVRGGRPAGAARAGRCAGPGCARAVASTHGHEVGWAMLPGARQVLRRVGAGQDVVTYLGDVHPQPGSPRRSARARSWCSCPAGWTPSSSAPTRRRGPEIRARHGLGDRPVVVCVSRLVERKGQDTLVRALPEIRTAGARTRRCWSWAAARTAPRVERLAREHGGRARTSCSPAACRGRSCRRTTPPGDVFAMPCRTRRRGLEVEGLGIVYLEANAAGLPVVAGDSGGAPDAVREGETGHVVRGGDVAATAGRCGHLLADPVAAAAMGARGPGVGAAGVALGRPRRPAARPAPGLSRSRSAPPAAPARPARARPRPP